ncbi:MAG: ectoine synthase [Nitriliruptor sp.]|nr:MAG: ectoine synthase [Nitriliruptor sp.]
MIVRRLNQIEGTDNDVKGPTFASRRLLLADDRLDYSLHDTVLYAGSTTSMWYRNHAESVYCVEGSGVLTDHETGEAHDITPGTLYVLDGHERHELRATTDLRVVCVFTPALTGQEIHDDDGTYPLLAAAGSGLDGHGG